MTALVWLAWRLGGTGFAVWSLALACVVTFLVCLRAKRQSSGQSIAGPAIAVAIGRGVGLAVDTAGPDRVPRRPAS